MENTKKREVSKNDFLESLNFCRNAEPYYMEEIMEGAPNEPCAVAMYTIRGNTLLGEYDGHKFYMYMTVAGKFERGMMINDVIYYVKLGDNNKVKKGE